MNRQEQKYYCRKKHGKDVFRYLGLCRECWLKFKMCHLCWVGKGDGDHPPEQHIDLPPGAGDLNS